MIFEDALGFWLVKSLIITAGTLGMMSSITVFRINVKKILLSFTVYLLWVTASTAVILHYFGFNGILRLFPLTISIPAFFVVYKMDICSPAQAVFNYASQIVLSLILTMTAVLINLAVHGGKNSELVIRLVIYAAVIFLEYRFLRRPFRRLTDIIQTGWGFLSLIPVSFSLFLILLGTIPVHYTSRPLNILYLIGAAAMMLLVYFVMFQNLSRQSHLYMADHGRELLKVQITAMNTQAAAIAETEKQLKILRHDARHLAEIMQAHLKKGSVEQASLVLSSFEAAFRSSTAPVYCEDYVINSILTFYLERAKKSGIEVRVSFTPPSAEKIDTITFSVMLANALENALDACSYEGTGRFISLKSRMFNGQYLMELINSRKAPILFDSDAVPLSQKGDGHGIGVRSILAFAKEHNAVVSFRMEDGCFVLQMTF